MKKRDQNNLYHSRWIVFSIIGAILMCFSATSAYAADFSIGTGVNIEKAGYVLLLVLVLAILLETGLSTLFSWRIFLRYFEEKGLKVPIAVLTAFLFVQQFDIDAIAEILGAFAGKTYNHGTLGKLLTAFIIAGGSSAIFTLFEKFGIRNPLERKAVAASMRNESRLKVKLLRNGSPNDKPVSILVDDTVIGAIDSQKNEFGGFLGQIVEAGQRKLKLKSRDQAGKEIECEKVVSIAPGATVIETFQLTPDALNP